MDVNIRLETFEGPFDLLFHLIEKNEIDIYNIPISIVTDQYMEYLNQSSETNMETTSEFLVMAATLIEIKSKMLLPNSKYDLMEEEFNSDDPRYDLVQKLIEYRKFKNIALFLKDREEEYGKIQFKKQEDLNEFVKPIAFKDQDIQFETDILLQAVRNIINKMDKLDMNRKNYFSTLKRDEFTVESKIELIKNKITKSKKILFRELFSDTAMKSEVIVTFLALLELLKIKVISIKQEKQFSVIYITQK